MKIPRNASREDLDSNTVKILMEFEKQFFPASIRDVGNEFIIFLLWLKQNSYIIVKK